MKIVTSGRRQIVMAMLLCFAVAGAVIRLYAPNPSTLRDIGTLLLVLWVPAIGNVVAFVIRKAAPRWRRVQQFDERAPFAPQLQVELLRVASAAAPDDRNFIVLLGQEGFRARSATALSSVPGHTSSVALELLRPEVALPRLTPGTAFQLLAGAEVVATGRVVAPA